MLETLGEDRGDPFGPNDMPSLRLSGDFGYSYWVGGWEEDSLTKAAQDHFHAMKHSRHFAGSGEWFFFPRGSLGITYVRFDSHAKTDNLRAYSHSTQVADAKDDITYTLMGPLMGTRQSLGRGGILYASFSVGYLKFEDRASFNAVPYHYEIKTYGIVPALAWDFPIAPFISAGITSRAILANVDKYTLNGKQVDLSQSNTEDIRYQFQLHRFDIGLGLRITLSP